MIRVLRMGTSDAWAGEVPPELRQHAVLGRELERALGEPVEVTVEGGWPNSRWSAMVERWIGEFRPDIVLLEPNWFWWGYESIPLRIERATGLRGKVAKVALNAGKSKYIADSVVASWVTRTANRFVRGANYCTPEEVLSGLDGVFHTVLAHEDVVFVVQAPPQWSWARFASSGYVARSLAKTMTVSEGLARLCATAQVPLIPAWRPSKDELQWAVTAAGTHLSVAGHDMAGKREAAFLAARWRELHP